MFLAFVREQVVWAPLILVLVIVIVLDKLRKRAKSIKGNRLVLSSEFIILILYMIYLYSAAKAYFI